MDGVAKEIYKFKKNIDTFGGPLKKNQKMWLFLLLWFLNKILQLSKMVREMTMNLLLPFFTLRRSLATKKEFCFSGAIGLSNFLRVASTSNLGQAIQGSKIWLQLARKPIFRGFPSNPQTNWVWVFWKHPGIQTEKTRTSEPRNLTTDDKNYTWTWIGNMVGMTLPLQPFPEAGCTECKMPFQKKHSFRLPC